MPVWIALAWIQQCLWVRVSRACFKLMMVLHTALMENMCKGSRSPFMHMSALEKSRMRWIKPLHQDYFWEFLNESSKCHVFHNLNYLYNCAFPSANKNICKWMKERKIMFLCASGGHKRIIVLLVIAVFSVKWKDIAIANHLKKYCCFLKNEKQHLS